MKKRVKPQSYLPLGSIAAILMGTLPTHEVIADASPSPTPQSCNSKLSGGGNSVMVSNNGNYECAYYNNESDREIGPSDSQSWTSNSVAGYWPLYTCQGQTGGLTMSHADAYTDFGGSITYNVQNPQSGDRHWGAAMIWQTQANGGVLGSQYVQNCNGEGATVYANYLFISTSTIAASTTTVALGSPATFTVTLVEPYGNSPATGTVYLYQQASSTGANPSTDYIIGSGTLSNNIATITTKFSGKTASGTPLSPVAGTVQIYAAFAGTGSGTKPPATPTSIVNGWLPTQTASTAVTLTAGTTSAPATASLVDTNEETVDSLPQTASSILAAALHPAAITPAGNLSAIRHILVNKTVNDESAPIEVVCPKGTAPIHASMLTNGFKGNRIEDYHTATQKGGVYGIKLNVPKQYGNFSLDLQLVCRDLKEKPEIAGGLGYGSIKADIMASIENGDTLFSGYGADLVTLSHSASTAYTGPGNDRVILRADKTTGSGGLGNDHLQDNGPGPSLIIGGPGRDVLIGGLGATSINAIDGKGGDHVICNSPQNVVRKDDGDKVIGPCTIAP